MTDRREFSRHPDRPDEHSDRTPSSDQAGPSRPARARGLRFSGSTWENLQVSSNESSTTDEQRLRQQERQEQARREQQTLEYRQERLENIQYKREKRLNERKQKTKNLEDLMYKLEYRDQLPHENNLQKLDDQLYKQDLDMLEHIGRVYMLEKRIEQLEYVEQQIPENLRHLPQPHVMERIKYIEQFETHSRYAEEQLNNLTKMENRLKKHMGSRLGQREKNHLNQMMDKLRIELEPLHMEIEN